MTGILKENQVLAVEYLANGLPAIEIAKKLKVTPETVSRWRRDPHFVAALNVILADRHEYARIVLRNQLDTAICVVRDVMLDTSSPARTRLAAAIHVIDLALVTKPSAEAVGLEDGTEVKQRRVLEKYSIDQRLANG